MPLNALGLLVAELPAAGHYFDPVKIVVYFLAVILWAYNAAWVQSDTKALRIQQSVWVPATCGIGAVGLVLWLVVPIFWLGLLLFVLMHGGILIPYVVVRNGRVAPGQSMLTPAHFQRLLKGGKSGTVEVDTTERTRIKDANGKTPPWPTDPAERAAFQCIQDVLFDAIFRRATDVRMDFIGSEPIKVYYRIDGVDRAREPYDAAHGLLMLTLFKRIGGLNPEEHRKPQSGRFKAAIGAGGKGDRSVEIDIRTSGSTAGQRIVLKLLSEESKFRLPGLGLSSVQLPVVQSIIKAPKGVVLVSGPRGAGVTSTLYAMLREHDAFMQNIHTLEIAKAMDVENVTQHVFENPDGTTSFGKRLRSILRSEPDVCMASDMPDAETAALVAAAGRQGKKIYLGISARDTFSALRAYLAGVNDAGLAGASLLAVTNQRLMRMLCTNCRKAYKPDPAILKKANLPLDENKPFFRPPNPNEIETDKHGNPIPCAFCQGSGYLGRTGVFECLVFDDELRAMLAKSAPLPNLKAEARKKGMLYLQEVALRKVYEGVTSINEVLRVKKETEQQAAATV